MTPRTLSYLVSTLLKEVSKIVFQGIRHRKKVGTDKRIAREVLDDILGRVARRLHLGVIEDSKISFGDFSRILN